MPYGVDSQELSAEDCFKLNMADAEGLLESYNEIEESLPPIPSKSTEPVRVFPNAEWTVNNTPASAAKRSDNKSGHTGVSKKKNKWEARICYKGIRYVLGSFKLKREAIAARKAAEKALKEDPERFVKEYSERYSHHTL